MSYLLSKYTMYKNYPEKQKLVVTNLSNGNTSIFVDKACVEAQRIINGKQGSCAAQDFFIQKGYIVDSKIDETDDVYSAYFRILENSDTLLLVILLTEQCNFRCKYCCESFSDRKLSYQDQTTIIEFLRRNLHKYKKLQVEWFGGEPLLEAETIERMTPQILEICKKNKVKYYSSMSTNGYFLTLDMFRRMKKCRVVNYQITIDGMKETHDSQRVNIHGVGSWETIIKNLQDIKEKISSRMFSIMIRTNITNQIFSEREQYIAFLKKQFGDDDRFSFIWRLAEDWGNISTADKKMLCGVREYKEIAYLAMKAGLRNRHMRRSILPGGRSCEAIKKNSLVIFPNGVVGKCARNERPDISHIGNIEDLLTKPDELLNMTLASTKSVTCQACNKFLVCLGKACPFTANDTCGYEMLNFDLVLDTLVSVDDTLKPISYF